MSSITLGKKRDLLVVRLVMWELLEPCLGEMPYCRGSVCCAVGGVGDVLAS